MHINRISNCYWLSGLILFGFLVSSEALVAQQRPIVIAHRGASGYVPEHTLAGTALAYGMGADYIEQDVVLTRDDQPIVLHDIHLDTVTNVAQLFPDRARDDGRFYAIDFSLSEIQELSVHERVDLRTGKRVFPNRFPAHHSQFQVPTLSQAIELVQGMNRSTGRQIGIYPEIKQPSWHRKQGKEITPVVLKVLAKYGYETAEDPVFLQCFDPNELKQIRQKHRSKLKLVQLIGANSWGDAGIDYERMLTPEGLDEVAEYAQGIGPWMPQLVPGRATDGKLEISPVTKHAHQRGLVVHPFTFRADALPEYAPTFDELVRIFKDQVRVDGFFTDFPDRIDLAN